VIRSWLLLLVALAVGAAAAWLLRADAGYVLMNYGPWVVETSLLGLLGTLVVALAIMVWSFRLLFAGLRLPRLIRQLLDHRREERARDTFEEGMLRLLEGNWKRAEIELVRRAADHHASHLNYLAAARAAQRLGAPDRRDHYLQLAASGDSGHDFAVLLTQTELQLERGEYAAARDTALRAREQDPKHPYAIELLAAAFEGLSDWEALRGLLLETTKLNALSAERRDALMRRAMIELIAQAESASQLDRLKALWDASGSELRREPALRLRYARALHRLNADAEAAALIGDALRDGWDGDLVTLYGHLHGSDGVTRLASIEQWLSQYGERIELLLTAGQACLQNKLWGKARSYLEAAASTQPSPGAYLELARLAEQTQNPEDAARYYRLGLELAA
jgi:HemY protein